YRGSLRCDRKQPLSGTVPPRLDEFETHGVGATRDGNSVGEVSAKAIGSIEIVIDGIPNRIGLGRQRSTAAELIRLPDIPAAICEGRAAADIETNGGRWWRRRWVG